jgi:hypothetical protein
MPFCPSKGVPCRVLGRVGYFYFLEGWEKKNEVFVWVAEKKYSLASFGLGYGLCDMQECFFCALPINIYRG